MDIENKNGERLVMKGRVQIDTRAPFKSVKEAVMVFGERVLVTEIYASKLKEMEKSNEDEGYSHSYQSRIGDLTAELEETAESLEKAIQENNMMSSCIRRLKEELEETKKELTWLKTRNDEYQKQQAPVVVDSDSSDIHDDFKTFMEEQEEEDEDEEDDGLEFHKERSVRFASPPSLTRVISTTTKEVDHHQMVDQKPQAASVKKIKKKMMPLLGWFLSMKKNGKGH